MIYRPADSAELAATVVASGDSILLRGGVTYAASSMPASISSAANLTIGYTGSGERAIISGGVVRADWTYDAGNNVYSRAYGSNVLGNVTEDGVPMRFTTWTTDVATTTALMDGTSNAPHWQGAMTYDPATFTVYIRPSSGTASQHVYVVSESNYGIYVSNTVTGLLIDGLDIRNISRHGITAFNRNGIVIQDTDFRVMGGHIPGALYMGNGIELASGCNGALVQRCRFYDIFDSGATTQLYESTPKTISGHTYIDNYGERYGLTVIEISTQAANQTITDVEVSGLVAVDGQQYSWGGDRGIGSAVSFLCSGAGSKVTRGFVKDMRCSRQRRSYIGFQHGGVCGIEDSTATGSYFSAPVSSVGAYGPQRDLYRNFTDDYSGPAVAPSGGSWVASTANMSNAFRGMTL